MDQGGLNRRRQFAAPIEGCMADYEQKPVCIGGESPSSIIGCSMYNVCQPVLTDKLVANYDALTSCVTIKRGRVSSIEVLNSDCTLETYSE